MSKPSNVPAGAPKPWARAWINSFKDHLQKRAEGNDAGRSIEEFERLAGGGNSNGWKFDRDEIHERK